MMNGSKREFFSPEDDEKLKALVEVHGTNAWPMIANLMSNKTTRQCRERFKNYLDPNLNRSKWTPEEDQLLIEKFAMMGPVWSKMVPFFNNRADVDIKNHWSMLSSRLRKRHHFIPIQIPMPTVMPMIPQPMRIPEPMIAETKKVPETVKESASPDMSIFDFFSNFEPSSEPSLIFNDNNYDDFDLFY